MIILARSGSKPGPPALVILIRAATPKFLAVLILAISSKGLKDPSASTI